VSAPSLVPAVDLAGLHRTLDMEVDVLYGRQCLLADGLAVLLDVFREPGGAHPRGAELHFMIQALQHIAHGVLLSADRITAAIEPIEPATEGKS
jgi:hypothetical protein